jgi:L-lactate dehydrogenase (cytochrome)
LSDLPGQPSAAIEAAPAARPATSLDAAESRPRLSRRLRQIYSLEDLDAAARRFLPKPLYSYVAEGAETQAAVHANRASFAEWALVPNVLRDTSARQQSTTLLGRSYDMPFGIAPMGGAALVGFEADLAFARAARAAKIPMVLSAASLIAMEKVRAAYPGAWYQAYVTGERAALTALLQRVERAGFDTLVLTVDVPVIANRENYLRNGFSLPLRPSLKLAGEGLAHPGWLFGTFVRTLLRNGMPHVENMTAARGAPALARVGPRHLGRRDALNWTDFEWLRKAWKGKLVLKGVLASADALRARDIGADGLILSNHGGRQLDGAVTALRVLPEIAAAAGDMTIMIDGGIRRGTDVVKALALGAKFVFVARPFLFAAAIGGEPGVAHAVALLAQEIDCDLALLGASALSEITREMLIPARAPGP